MVNRRIFWAVQGVLIGKMGYTTLAGVTSTVNGSAIYHSSTVMNPVMGVQSVGITTNFNLEQAFELGQLALYENIEEVPDIEVTMEKVIDGAPLIYHLATPGATGAGLVGRSTARCDVRLAIYDDTAELAGGAGNKLQAEVYCSGMYVSSIAYSFPVDGNCTESVTLVGNHKEWIDSGGEASVLNVFTDTAALGMGTLASPTAAPSGVQRRENVDVYQCTFPAEITSSGVDGGLEFTSTDRKVHINSISTSADLGREEIRELGKKGPYFRYVTFPLEVTCDFEVTATSGDFVNAFEEGRSSDKKNLNDRTIIIVLDEGLAVNLGTKNKLSSVTYGGGDTGGGNSTITFSYSTFNDFTVTHPRDPMTQTDSAVLTRV